jgi:hypothetical protein
MEKLVRKIMISPPTGICRVQQDGRSEGLAHGAGRSAGRLEIQVEYLDSRHLFQDAQQRRPGMIACLEFTANAFRQRCKPGS